MPVKNNTPARGDGAPRLSPLAAFVCRFNEYTLLVPAGCGEGLNKMLLKFIWKNKWLSRAKEILKSKNNERGLDRLDNKILE